MIEHAYPSELAAFVHTRWLELDHTEGAQTVLGGALPPHPLLTKLLSVAYQATLLRDEERAVSFRLVLGDPAAFPANAGPPDGIHRLVFDTPRPYTEHELRRLSPAAKYHRSLIGIRQNEVGNLEIWGVLHSGPRWLQATNGGRGVRSVVLTEALVIRATGPGRLAVARGESMVGEVRGGRLSGPTMDVFTSEWLPGRFVMSRAEVAAQHREDRALAKGWAPIDGKLGRRFSQEMVKRMIATIRSAHHGGTVVFLDDDEVRELRDNPAVLRMKYEFADEEPRRRYRTLIRRALGAVAAAGGAAGLQHEVGWEFYEVASSPELSLVEEAIFEMSHSIAGFANVDGVVVLTTRFEILGFGGEIGALSEVRTVRRAIDLESATWEEEPVEGVGTRHRSAYRLCQRFQRAVVVLVSQDGPIRFITWHDGAVTYWDHTTAGWVDT